MIKFQIIVIGSVLFFITIIPDLHAQWRDNSPKLSISNKTISQMYSNDYSMNKPGISGASNNGYFKAFAACGVVYFCSAICDEEIDEEYSLEFHKFPQSLLKNYGEIGNLYDNNQTYLAIAGLSAAAVGYGIITKNHKPIETVTLMAKSWIATTLVTAGLKVAIGRHRPYINDGPFQFDPFVFNTSADWKSFPSGHTSSVFSLMTVLAKQYNDPWVKYPAYAFATSVAFQRMLYRKHWASDVIAGGLIGYWISSAYVNRKDTHSLIPFFDGTKLGFVFVR